MSRISNQVEENGQNKYHPMKGVNLYQVVLPQTLPFPPSVQVPIQWADQVILDNTVITLDGVEPGRLTALKSGIYSYQFDLTFQDAVDPINNVIEWRIGVNLGNYLGETGLNGSHLRIPGPGLAGDASRSINMSGCVYLERGNYLVVRGISATLQPIQMLYSAACISLIG